MPNFPAAILSATVVMGAAWALVTLDPARRPEAIAHEMSLQPVVETATVASLYAEALRRDSANPYRWADLGDALAQDRRLPEARHCLQRALELNRRLPQIWLRDANFHFTLGETDAALRSAAYVLRTVPDYDGVLFMYFDRMVDNPDRVLAEIGSDQRAAVSYATHLIATAQVEAARRAWLQLVATGYADDRVTASYIDLLLSQHRYPWAEADWARYAGADASNLVYNGGFEKEPDGAALDWTIRNATQFETGIDGNVAHDGKKSLHIRFLGSDNVSYGNVVQKILLQPGSYELTAWVRADGITTNEGPRLAVSDAEVPSRLAIHTEPFVGTSGWTLVRLGFTAPAATRLVNLAVVRLPSAKFDSKIAGSFWLDSLRLARTKY